MNCPCGRPLHYNTVTSKLYMDELVREKGELQKVTNPDGTWMVPRHYIALHGIAAVDLPALAAKYGWERVA